MTRALTLEELFRLEQLGTDREQLLVRLLYETGVKLSEMDKIQLHGDTILVAKRKMPASKRLATMLRKHGVPRISSRRVEQLLSKLGRQALGRRVTPHELRHTRIIHDFLNRVSIPEIEERCGLKSIQPHLYQFYAQGGFS